VSISKLHVLVFVQEMPLVVQEADSIVRAHGITLSYKQTLEGLLTAEIQTIRSSIELPLDSSPTATIQWWNRYGPDLPLLYVFAKIAIVTAIANVEVERQFGCEGKFQS